MPAAAGAYGCKLTILLLIAFTFTLIACPIDKTASKALSPMSVLSHFVRPLPVSRRAYSIFSKPGGGRYFNSAKPSKVVAPTAAVKGKDAPSPTEVSASPCAKDDVSASPSPVVPEGQPLASLSLPLANVPLPTHPPVNPQELKLHQFFSLHRPLLTVSQPISSFFEPTSLTTRWPPVANAEPANFSTIDDPPEPSPEADADAARQLARAFVVSRVGASLAWEDTLKRLGLDLTAGRAEEVSQAQAEYEILMDSTKRKRRKKMKKHK